MVTHLGSIPKNISYISVLHPRINTLQLALPSSSIQGGYGVELGDLKQARYRINRRTNLREKPNWACISTPLLITDGSRHLVSTCSVFQTLHKLFQLLK